MGSVIFKHLYDLASACRRGIPGNSNVCSGKWYVVVELLFDSSGAFVVAVRFSRSGRTGGNLPRAAPLGMSAVGVQAVFRVTRRTRLPT
ncbi:hypothetical protein ABZ807_28865 [Micromonospora sp. NPDC047548]|uniref:hypothetical protein n=1 Tax=Micromonospora sp. NPDC047548 TaxID=3155624 RepID=UPI0033EB9CA4